ncbi:hypothetical protein ASF84_05315 [Pseudomonas sp. Leaf127]|uniref:hypothetical protein n=1 Tax=Pseudomonas sp. Leaf127 TaxID=1736267 RepID=UPI0007035CB5|nr:hypothetical protein [Pseudomonas sp. Leaf127]KQQ60128.1 hypothetical protein ASF84_05315 [Pseudomonas sp. Leaf127]
MTQAQRNTVNQMVADGFHVVLAAKDIVRLSRGADARIVMADGSQKRANHADGVLLMSKFRRGKA